MKTFLMISLFLIFGSMTVTAKVSMDMVCSKVLSALPCTFEFTNKGPEDIHLLTRNTPLEGLYSQFITVYSQKGQPLKYKGMYVNRDSPVESEFVHLKAGKSISATVDITKAFSIDSDGLYTVEYNRPVQYTMAFPYKLHNAYVRQSGSIYLEEVSRLSRPQEERIVYKQNGGGATPAPPAPPAPPATPAPPNCAIQIVGATAAQDALIRSAHTTLCGQTPHMEGRVANNNVYTRFFGVYTDTRSARVREVYREVANDLRNAAGLTYNLNGPLCKSNWNGYAYTPSTTVYLCPAFFNKGNLCDGTAPTQESIEFHEWTHAIATTTDNSYGVANNEALARNSPDRAVENADSYEMHYCVAAGR